MKYDELLKQQKKNKTKTSASAFRITGAATDGTMVSLGISNIYHCCHS